LFGYLQHPAAMLAMAQKLAQPTGPITRFAETWEAESN
jgi:hypothetical protein